MADLSNGSVAESVPPVTTIEASSNLLDDPEIKKVLVSDSAFEILLHRLKQSVKACEEFAIFVRRKHSYEQSYARDIRKAASASKGSIASSCVPSKGSVVDSLTKVINFDNRLVTDVRTPYIKALETMYSELFSLAQNFSKSRKQLKEESSRYEKEVADAIAQAEKSRSKYQSICQDLEKCRNSDQTQKKITLGGRKTGSQQEEELTKKLQVADADYNKKANFSQKCKNELVDNYRPQLSSKLQDLILELDNALQLQLAKYSVYNESLIVGMGNQVTPLGKNHVSMRDVASSVDCEKCLYDYLKNSKVEVKPVLAPVEYKRHNAYDLSTMLQPASKRLGSTSSSAPPPLAAGAPPKIVSSVAEASLSTSSYPPPAYRTADPRVISSSSMGSLQQEPATLNGPRPIDSSKLPNLDQAGGLFGQPIDAVAHDDEMVPLFVKRCVELLEEQGAHTEGIYRLSPNKTRLDELSRILDRSPDDLSVLDPPDPITDDYIHVVASLHKKFFASLPDPLLTYEQTKNFMKAGQIDDVKTMHLQLHRIVFELPDSNYFTLRDLLFHFVRLSEIPTVRMGVKNIAIVWSNNLFAPNSATTADDLRLQQRVIEELVNAAPDIFNPVEE